MLDDEPSAQDAAGAIDDAASIVDTVAAWLRAAR
jgi:hypothetical protein